MFGLSKRERVAEGLRRAAIAAMDGVRFTVDDIARFGLSDEASAYLFTDAIAHRLFMLSVVLSDQFKGESWNTFEFFVEGIKPGILERERTAGLVPYSMFSMLMSRYNGLLQIPTAQARNGGRLLDTARRVADLDDQADPMVLKDILERAVMDFMNEVDGYFPR